MVCTISTDHLYSVLFQVLLRITIIKIINNITPDKIVKIKNKQMERALSPGSKRMSTQALNERYNKIVLNKRRMSMIDHQLNLNLNNFKETDYKGEASGLGSEEEKIDQLESVRERFDENSHDENGT
eukprot:CAMPEP_0170534630 /NCGR_PEP_ID=MMETSP0209-20121228/93265_1 /TAXON_ID=665100 ORGANISM="Litonotus pictus, Strain P1" /NCGR_SAMPLE_ID=MMETSP0209 /ASSEMBLY_ACC=CAM_ASM_000301 /LENGTH=126 /DNA_ID=CAMNT_0010834317 /DNA_START=173 /DNA_END=549 /DNA_ORIENTATION=+